MILYCLHFLGGSARSWTQLAAEARTVHEVVAIDLPGFGDAKDLPGYTVAAMADHVTRHIAAAGGRPYALAGHSMGAKVAMLLARRAEDGDPALAGLQHLALLAGSPPSSEPMEDAQRSRMLGWFAGTAAQSAEEARGYIGQNSAGLPPEVAEAAAQEVVRCHPAAWQHWLEHSSREDLAASIGRLRTPALLLAGAQDEALGEATQRRLTMPHLEQATLVSLPGAKHLLPLEQPREVAGLLQRAALAAA